VVNAAKVVLTSDKAEKKIAYRHTGYPGGLRETRYTDLMATRPEEAVRKAIKGMLPKNRLGRSMLGKLKVYAGPTHPHVAQNPVPLDLASARRPV
jgi:large subunit ribosomal protein L13